MKLKIHGIVVLIIFLANPVGAQTYHFPVARIFPAPGPEKYYKDKLDKDADPHGPGIQYNFLVQSGFFNGWPGSGFYSTVAPSFRYSVSPRFSVSGGIMLSSFAPTGRDVSGDRNLISPTGMNYNLLLYAEGRYMLKPNFFLTGSVMKNLTRNRAPFMQNPMLFPSGDSYSLRMDYFFSKSFRIGAEFRYIRNDRPYFGYPYLYSPYQPWF